MTQKKTEKFHIDYTLDPKTQNVKLTFSKGKQRATVLWEDARNTWKKVVTFCENMGDYAIYEDLGTVLHIGGSTAKTRREIIADTIYVGGKEEAIDLMYIASSGWDETREEKEWIRRKKIYATFAVPWQDVRREMYKVVSALACDPKYVGEDKVYTKKSKYELLSCQVAQAIDPENGFKSHCQQTLKCLKNHAFDGIDFYNRGLALYHAKEYKKALNDYNMALKKKKDLDKDTLTWCYRERGRVYKALKQYKKAEKDYLMAMKLNPKYSSAYLSLANLYVDLKKYDKALTYELKEYKFNPKDSALLYNLAMSYRRKKQWKKALSFLEKARASDPEEASIPLQIGRCYYEMKRFEKEREIHRQLLTDFSSGKIRFKYPEVDSKLLAGWAEEFIKRKKFASAISLAFLGRSLGFKGYDALMKKIEKLNDATKK